MLKNYSNLTSAANEIISNSTPQKYNQITPTKSRKIITKSYKITNDTTNQDYSVNINNNSSNVTEQDKQKIFKETSNTINENKQLENILNNQKTKTTINLSNVMYKDGYILKDAVNSNPGFGLWSIKMPTDSEFKSKKLITQEEFSKTKNINDISIKNDDNTDYNYKYTNYSNIHSDYLQNKKLVEKLTNRLNDLEKKYLKTVTDFQEKKNSCQNAVKMKNEYEKLINDNKNETKFIREKIIELDNDNNVLTDSLNNVKNEIKRLMLVMKEDKENLEQLKNEFENRLIKEQNEKNRLNEIIKKNEKEITTLDQEVNQKLLLQKQNISKNLNENNINKNGLNKKDYEIKKLKEIELDLQIKICNMKKKIALKKENMQKFKEVLGFRERREEMQKYTINNIFSVLEEQEYNKMNINEILKKKNAIIKNLREKNKDIIDQIYKKHNEKYGISRNIKNNNLKKSSSQLTVNKIKKEMEL